jgi:hypothetical protein
MGQFSEWNRFKRAERRADKMLYSVAALGVVTAFLVSTVAAAAFAVLVITMVGMSWAWAQANRAEERQGVALSKLAAADAPTAVPIPAGHRRDGLGFLGSKV